MGLINLRDLVSYQNGDNSSDTVINGVHFNLTALQQWNYTLYSNKTISNDSNCYLIFDNYMPVVLANGTFVNGTSCSAPILPLETRGRLSAVFGTLFGISIMFTLINLKKHGQQYLREDKRFKLIGRRWQWYWMLFIAGCGMISTITGIDVDRDYLQDLAIILQSFFFFCTGQAATAAVWEGVRHWGSWQERQIVDRDPFSLPQDDKRGKIEFYMPLAFYFFTFMSFFLTVPRGWDALRSQGGVEQQDAIAKPAATDGRFKSGAIFLCASWFVIVYCVKHNLDYYRLRAHPSQQVDGRRNPFTMAMAIRFLPIRFTLAIGILAVSIGYGVASTWIFDLSIMKYNGNVVWPFALGYTPWVLILLIFNIWGFIEKNEDKELIQQRVARGRAADADIGLTKKPNWWSKARGDHHLDDMSRLRGLVADSNIHGAGTGHRRNRSGSVEMDNLSPTGSSMPKSTSTARLTQHDGLRTRSPSARGRETYGAGIPRSSSMLNPLESRPLAERDDSPGGASVVTTNTVNTTATGTTLTGERQQVVRSMLDV